MPRPESSRSEHLFKQGMPMPRAIELRELAIRIMARDKKQLRAVRTYKTRIRGQLVTVRVLKPGNATNPIQWHCHPFIKRG